MTNYYDAKPHEGVGRDRIYVTWTEQWDLPRYAADFVLTRSKRIGATTAADVLLRIAMYPGHAPFRKADMDFYLERHFAK